MSPRARPRGDAVVLDGKVWARQDDGTLVECLRPGQVATRYAVRPERPSRWVADHGPGTATPHPVHVPGAHVVVHGQRLPLATAMDAWVAALTGGRPASQGGARRKVRA